MSLESRPRSLVHTRVMVTTRSRDSELNIGLIIHLEIIPVVCYV